MVNSDFSAILKAFQKRQLAILVDDSLPELRSVLFCPATIVSAQQLNEILLLSGSQVYVTLDSDRAKQFDLAPMARPSSGNLPGNALRVLESVEAREGIHTGISIADRVTTIRILSEDLPNAKKLVKPGHIFPVEVSDGGVLVRAAMMEAVADASSLGFGTKVAAVVDLLNDRGEYCNAEEIESLARRENLPVFNLSMIIVFRLTNTPLVEKISEAAIPLASGSKFKMTAYRSRLDGVEHVALSLGEPFEGKTVLTRVHRENLFSDLFSADETGQESSLKKAIRVIEQAGQGLVVYLRASQQEAFQNLDKSFPRTALFRDYGIGAQIIKESGARNLALLTSSHLVPEGLQSFGLEIKEIQRL